MHMRKLAGRYGLPRGDTPSHGGRNWAEGYSGQALTFIASIHPVRAQASPPSSHPRMCGPLLQALCSAMLAMGLLPLSPLNSESALLYGGGWVDLSTLLDARALRTRTVCHH